MLMLLFNLGQDRYAIETSQILEVISMVNLQKVPHVPDYVLGTFIYRGLITPVIDLRKLIQGEPCQIRLSTRIIIVNFKNAHDNKDQIRAFMVERLTENIRKQEVELADPGIKVDSASYLGKIIKDEQGMIQCICIEHLWSDSF